jgi:hypothetical protein
MAVVAPTHSMLADLIQHLHLIIHQHLVTVLHLEHKRRQVSEHLVRRRLDHRHPLLEQPEQVVQTQAGPWDRINRSLHYKENKMKTLLTIIAVVFATGTMAAPETKRVCHTDPKTKKEVCKNIKVHKKVEGTKVPEKQKKK